MNYKIIQKCDKQYTQESLTYSVQQTTLSNFIDFPRVKKASLQKSVRAITLYFKSFFLVRHACGGGLPADDRQILSTPGNREVSPLSNPTRQASISTLMSRRGLPWSSKVVFGDVTIHCIYDVLGYQIVFVTKPICQGFVFHKFQYEVG